VTVLACMLGLLVVAVAWPALIRGAIKLLFLAIGWGLILWGLVAYGDQPLNGETMAWAAGLLFAPFILYGLYMNHLEEEGKRLDEEFKVLSDMVERFPCSSEDWDRYEQLKASRHD